MTTNLRYWIWQKPKNNYKENVKVCKIKTDVIKNSWKMNECLKKKYKKSQEIKYKV